MHCGVPEIPASRGLRWWCRWERGAYALGAECDMGAGGDPAVKVVTHGRPPVRPNSSTEADSDEHCTVGRADARPASAHTLGRESTRRPGQPRSRTMPRTRRRGWRRSVRWRSASVGRRSAIEPHRRRTTSDFSPASSSRPFGTVLIASRRRCDAATPPKPSAPASAAVAAAVAAAHPRVAVNRHHFGRTLLDVVRRTHSGGRSRRRTSCRSPQYRSWKSAMCLRACVSRQKQIQTISCIESKLQ